VWGRRGVPVRGHSVGCGSRLVVCGGDPCRHDARGRVGGWFCGRRCRSAWRRFSVAKAARVSLRTLPGAVPVLEAKARSRTTQCGTRGWLLWRLRRGGAAHAGGGARCGLKSEATTE
jgi:hypothetical protein